MTFGSLLPAGRDPLALGGKNEDALLMNFSRRAGNAVRRPGFVGPLRARIVFLPTLRRLDPEVFSRLGHYLCSPSPRLQLHPWAHNLNHASLVGAGCDAGASIAWSEFTAHGECVALTSCA